METSRPEDTIHTSQTLLLNQTDGNKDDRIYETIDEDGGTYAQVDSLQMDSAQPAAKTEETYMHVIV